MVSRAHEAKCELDSPPCFSSRGVRLLAVTTRTRPRPSAAARPLRLILALAFLLLTGAAVAMLGARYLQVGEISVPELVGEDVEVAKHLLGRLELEVRTHAQYSPDLPAGSVVLQNPEPGTLVRSGRSVSLAVNLPPENVSVPELVGLPYVQAARELERASLSLDTTNYVYSAEPVGRVVAQEPAAGSSLRAGGGVDVSVSRGFEATPREVPRVIGLTLDDAKRQLERAGFSNVETVVSSVTRSGVSAVRAQSPEAGQVVLDKLPVTLYYNLADERVVEVPDLSGLSPLRAQLRLRQLGLEAAWISYEEVPEGPAGVIEVRPSGWTLRGSPVVLVVNGRDGELAEENEALTALDGLPLDLIEAPMDALTAPTEPEDTSGGRVVPIDYPVQNVSDRTYRFRLVVSDDEGQRTVFESHVRNGDRVLTSITVYGEAEVAIYLDDDWVFSWFP
jgi:beta-lactam-binding protein with PASTA domain